MCTNVTSSSDSSTQMTLKIDAFMTMKNQDPVIQCGPASLMDLLTQYIDGPLCLRCNITTAMVRPTGNWGEGSH